MLQFIPDIFSIDKKMFLKIVCLFSVVRLGVFGFLWLNFFSVLVVHWKMYFLLNLFGVFFQRDNKNLRGYFQIK